MAPPTASGVDQRTAVDLLTAVRGERLARDAAEVRILQLAVQWADRHTIDPATGFAVTRSFLEIDAEELGVDLNDPDSYDWLGLPVLRWDTAGSFAAALGMSTAGGKALIRDALVLSCRMPKIWARVCAGDVQTWRARRIAQAALGQPDDVVAYLDTDLAPRAGTIGPVLLDRAIDEAMLRLHPEEREIAQLEALDARYARLLAETINHTGIAEFAVRGDWADVAAFDDAVTAVAAALARAGCEETLDVRRSMAVGVLADPQRAQALLEDDDETPVSTTDGTSTRPARPAKAPRRRIVLNLDLHPSHLAGLDPVILDTEGHAMLDQIVREWCGRRDLGLWVRPIRHCGGCTDCPTGDATGTCGPVDHTVAYAPTARARERIARRDRHCVFPYCTRPASSCDADHIEPFARGGPTHPDNLALLCRHHHRQKTHAGWTYTMLEPGVYLWADRYGQHFIRTRHGTTDLT